MALERYSLNFFITLEKKVISSNEILCRIPTYKRQNWSYCRWSRGHPVISPHLFHPPLVPLNNLWTTYEILRLVWKTKVSETHTAPLNNPQSKQKVQEGWCQNTRCFQRLSSLKLFLHFYLFLNIKVVHAYFGQIGKYRKT